ncbi:MAG: NAD(+) synthase [Hyphomicrobiales bacterium]|nr:NAD(+) synthase [Hyphomicrobiales bacterium]
MSDDFYSIYAHGFLRAACAAPAVRVADPAFNLSASLVMARRAHERGAGLVVLPELGLSAYAIDDLLMQAPLLDGVERAAGELIAASAELLPVIVAGAPLRHAGRLYNCALVIHRGALLGVAPKTYLPNYREFYERRHFASGAFIRGETIAVAGHEAPFGADLLFAAQDQPDFVLGVEICEDVWAPIPPSTRAALAGATVIANLSASNAIVGKADYRDLLCKAHSGRCLAAYLYSAAGPGESTTDMAWDGQASIYENGEKLVEAPRFAREPQLAIADVDLARMNAERLRQGTFGDCADLESEPFRRVDFTLAPPRGDIGFLRAMDRFPFVPDDDARLSELCFEAFNIQAHGLRQRLEATGLKRVVIGVSGGLDSTQALLVCCTAFDQLGLPRRDILAYTLPAFATSATTKSNAWKLMKALGVGAAEIDVSPACRQMLADLNHPAARGEPVYDATYENVQAGARTSLLFRLANQHDAIVVGTGDLSELALGWCTYGVGDQMAHYNVNASVPKTLIQHLIRWCAADWRFGADAAPVLEAILGTEISPELVPGAAGDVPAQLTENFVGPYALQDFNLYWITRYGFGPRKVAFMAWHAWKDAGAGAWPPHIPAEKKRAYDLADIRKWLGVFVKRFFATSQFKRSAMPNGPKVSSGGSLSPRGDWRAPSDSSAAAWLAEVERIP